MDGMAPSATQPNAAAAGFHGLARAFSAIDAAPDLDALEGLLSGLVRAMLRRGEDATLRERTLAAVSAYFVRMRAAEGMDAQAALLHLRVFARETVQIVFNERPQIVPEEAPPADIPPAEADDAPRRRLNDKRGTDMVSQLLTPAVDLTDRRVTIADLHKPTNIHRPKPPPAVTYATFRELLESALEYRLCKLMRFFQRANTDIRRDLPRPFLLAPAFEPRFMEVVRTIIVPKMFVLSRNLVALASSRKWDEVNSAQFWDVIAENDKTRISFVGAWEDAWATCRQHETTRKAEKKGEYRKVLVVSPELKRVREILVPDSPDLYDLPQVRNPEIDLFVSFLTDFDLVRLEQCFTKLRQIYEQELDRRWYQDRARTGALRDSLLEAIDAFPDRTGDFLALLCYYCFPNTDVAFLERFTHNKGSNDASRLERLPYLMRFLSNERIPEIRLLEDEDRRNRELAVQREWDRLREEDKQSWARLHKTARSMLSDT